MKNQVIEKNKFVFIQILTILHKKLKRFSKNCLHFYLVVFAIS